VAGQVSGGRWKPLQHFLQASAFADVTASCGSSSKYAAVGLVCYARNDLPAKQAVRVTVELLNFMTGEASGVSVVELDMSAGAGTTIFFWCESFSVHLPSRPYFGLSLCFSSLSNFFSLHCCAQSGRPGSLSYQWRFCFSAAEWVKRCQKHRQSGGALQALPGHTQLHWVHTTDLHAQRYRSGSDVPASTTPALPTTATAAAAASTSRASQTAATGTTSVQRLQFHCEHRLQGREYRRWVAVGGSRRLLCSKSIPNHCNCNNCNSISVNGLA
jgi:hypothetical protein